MDLLKKSIKILEELQLKNGGIIATPLNGAYPYIYVRDAVIITKAFNRVNLGERSKNFYRFINKFSNLEHHKEIFHRYHQSGLPSVSRKHQHDNTGLVLHGIYDTYLHTNDREFLEEMWPLVEKCCNIVFRFVKKNLIETETSIHELYRLERGYELWTNCACTRGLYDASEIARILKKKKESLLWKEKARKIHHNIKKKMFNKKTGLYMKNLRFPEVTDISQMAPIYFNLEDSKKILKNTLNHIETKLFYSEIGGFRRFRKFEVTKDWHWYTGGSGGWIIFTAWMGRFQKKLGNTKKYKLYSNWIEKIAKKTNGYLPEHVSVKEEYNLWKENEVEFNSRILKGMNKSEKFYKSNSKKNHGENLIMWAFPLGWSHAEYILLKKNTF